ncbi:DUF982 domain-containing protein [Leisingera thetidis]|uniref:DUF982 domain-containing protein n=1 Tax=Leisingera thetidis TaxID=2930199 RepID=UPI0021F6E226|nr:DUF982 domain-containing protein [Leisingera thetidis]
MTERTILIEISWGTPITIFLPSEGRTRKITTIEQAHFWLQRAWPVSDRSRDVALEKIDAVMDCLAPVGAARAAFLTAVGTAGFQADHRTAA